MNWLKYGVATVVVLTICYLPSSIHDRETRQSEEPVYQSPPPRNTAIPDSLVDFAETLIGTPYNYGCSKPETGFDCSGFITFVFNSFGFSVPRSSVDFTHVGKEVAEKNAQRGDLVLFTGTNSNVRTVGHIGIVVSNNDSLRFIHSSSGKEYSVIITPLNDHYSKRFMKVIRVFDERGNFVL